MSSCRWSSTAASTSSTPSPVTPEQHTVGPVLTRAARRRTASGSPARSTLFHTVRTGTSAAPISCSTAVTARDWAAALGWLTSTTCTSRLAYAISSSVARKAATRPVGSFWMNPTVSVNSACCPAGRATRLVVGSRVAKSWSAASTPAPPSVRRFSSVDLPALVYPTSATTGTSFAWRRRRCVERCRRTCSSCFLTPEICLRRMRLSTSSCFSPMPLTIPPACRSRCVHIRVSLGSWYSACASSTCSLPSLVAARWAKMSRISAVRSAMAVPPPSSPSKARSCRGLSSTSKITVSAPRPRAAAATSCAFPRPM
mmetsp:Transcript_12531/g.35412  ORF Transcript_12531/g.35412 Transcript_12531/m.35412 type:complete len:313 (-) Transcript_12531:236-1174(-)